MSAEEASEVGQVVGIGDDSSSDPGLNGPSADADITEQGGEHPNDPRLGQVRTGSSAEEDGGHRIRELRQRSTQMPIWSLFNRGGTVSETSRVRWATCKACGLRIQGQSRTMQTHVMRCQAIDNVERQRVLSSYLQREEALATGVKRRRSSRGYMASNTPPPAEAARFGMGNRTERLRPESSSDDTMLGLVLSETSGQPEVKVLPKVDLGNKQGYARVRVILAGLCATDIALVKGYKDSPRNMVLGHEFVGVIDDMVPREGVSTERKLSIGDRVCSEINCTEPGRCHTWKTRAQDSQRTALGIFGANGAFAEYVEVPIENLHLVPEHVPDDVAVFAEPLAAACQILEENHIRQSDSIAILGAGKLGTLVAGVLSASLYNVCLLVRPSPLTGMVEANHARSISARNIPVFNSNTASLNSFDCVVDCTGSPLGLQRALALVKPRGKVILKSTYAPCADGTKDLDLAALVVKEVQVVGSRCGPFEVAMRMLSEGSVRPRCLISAEFKLENAKAAFEHATEPKVLKILIRP